MSNSPLPAADRLGAAVTMAIGLWIAAALVAAGRRDFVAELADRRARLASMSAAERTLMERHWRQFVRMDAAAQSRLRALHAALEHHPQRDELVAAMDRYCEWLKTLEPVQREELRQLPPQERLARATRYLEEQEARIARRLGRRGPMRGGFARMLLRSEGFRTWVELSDQDRRAVRQWLEAFITEHPPEELRRELEQANGAEERRKIVLRMFWPSPSPPKLPRQAVEDLRNRLSPEGRKVLERKDERDQARLAASWARLLLWYELGGRGIGLRWMPPPVKDEELARLLEQSLDAAERERILYLPPPEMTRQLRMLYYREQIKHGDVAPPPRPDGRERGPQRRRSEPPGWDGRDDGRQPAGPPKPPPVEPGMPLRPEA